MSVPTAGEKFSQLVHHLREAQSCAAMLSHLEKANDKDLMAKGWFAVCEMLGNVVIQVTKLATRKLQ